MGFIVLLLSAFALHFIRVFQAETSHADLVTKQQMGREGSDPVVV